MDKAKSSPDNKWVRGSGRQAIIKNITNGLILKCMPAWQGALKEKQINNLPDFIMMGSAGGRR